MSRKNILIVTGILLITYFFITMFYYIGKINGKYELNMQYCLKDFPDFRCEKYWEKPFFYFNKVEKNKDMLITQLESKEKK